MLAGRRDGAGQARAVFGEALRSELGEPRRLRAISSSPRSRVWRARLDGRPVVIKQVVPNSDVDRFADADQRFSRELTALRLAARVDRPVAPTLLGADPQARVLVLQRLTGRPLTDGWQVGYAVALARFHAAGRHADPELLPGWPGPEQTDADAFLTLADRLGVAVPAAVAADLHAVVERGGGARCLLHGDPCPDNLVATADGVRFFDLERAALGDGLVELAYLRMGFPTCWCVTSAAGPLLRAAEQAYRDAWLAETGEPVGGDLAEACIGWLIQGDALGALAERGAGDQLDRLVEVDWRWGTVTARERLAYRLGAVAGLIEDGEPHAGFGRLAAAMREAMLRRWPGLRPPPSRVPRGL